MAKDNRTIGKFKLEGISPAPRGSAQIEVTFDIDANGILKVTAKDKGTGKEQSVTITGSSTLDKAEIDRMVKEAAENSIEDKRRREEAEVRNEADTLIYQMERKLKEEGNVLAVHEKARIEQLLSELKTALQENAAVEKIRSIISDLTQAQAAFQQASSQAREPEEADTGRSRKNMAVVMM